MRIVMFVPSVISEWDNANAHFLRGIGSDLAARGHEVRIYEPQNGWSLTTLVNRCGEEAVYEFHHAFPDLRPRLYRPPSIDVDEALDDADVVLVHEWTDRRLVAAIGRHRARHGRYVLLFRDSGRCPPAHGAARSRRGSDHPPSLAGYDGVLAAGAAIAEAHRQREGAPRAWTWHEAADARTFRPAPGARKLGDVIWIGNGGTDQRIEALRTFLIEPVRALGVRAKVYGVGYPESMLREMQDAEIEYGGWLANYNAGRAMSRYRLTIHLPRDRHRLRRPSIRQFEALACGLPLICARSTAGKQSLDGLFAPGRDFLAAADSEQMRRSILHLLGDAEAAASLAAHGRRTILSGHTCAHRVEELLSICRGLGSDPSGSHRRGAEAQESAILSSE